MKYLIILMLMLSCFGDNAKQVKEAETTTTPESMEAMDETEDVANTEESDEAQAGFVEENDQCICTKEYDPVCGSDGINYPSPCQAGCAKVTEFTKGNCED